MKNPVILQISRTNVVLESMKSRIGRSCLLQHFYGKTRSHARHAARSNLSLANLNGPIRNTFIVFFLKPVRDNLAPGFPRALDLSLLHAQKSSGSRLLLTKTNKLRLSCRKKGKFETLKGFGGLKIYLQAEKLSVSNSKRKISSSSLRKTRSLYITRN